MDDDADRDIDATRGATPRPAAKKLYQKPELVKLGGMRDLTKATGYLGKADGGRFPRGFRTGF